MRKKKLRLQWVEEDIVIIPITARPDDAPRPAPGGAPRPSAKTGKLAGPSSRRFLSS